jgi:hypothetical protein
MGPLRDDIPTDGPAAWFDPDGLAQSVVYTPQAGAVVTIDALVEYGENLQEDRGYLVEKMTLRLQAADVAQPVEGDAVLIGAAGEYPGIRWIVQFIREGNGWHWTLECYKDARAKVQRMGGGGSPGGKG